MVVSLNSRLESNKEEEEASPERRRRLVFDLRHALVSVWKTAVEQIRQTLVSLNSRLESNKEEEEIIDRGTCAHGRDCP